MKFFRSLLIAATFATAAFATAAFATSGIAPSARAAETNSHMPGAKVLTDRETKHVAWGPRSASGMQLGIWHSPDHPQLLFAIIRNAGTTPVALNMMTLKFGGSTRLRVGAPGKPDGKFVSNGFPMIYEGVGPSAYAVYTLMPGESIPNLRALQLFRGAPMISTQPATEKKAVEFSLYKHNAFITKPEASKPLPFHSFAVSLVASDALAGKMPLQFRLEQSLSLDTGLENKTKAWNSMQSNLIPDTAQTTISSNVVTLKSKPFYLAPTAFDPNATLLAPETLRDIIVRTDDAGAQPLSAGQFRRVMQTARPFTLDELKTMKPFIPWAQGTFSSGESANSENLYRNGYRFSLSRDGIGYYDSRVRALPHAGATMFHFSPALLKTPKH